MNTQNFKALIVDDEADAREIIGFLLGEMFPQVSIVAQASSVDEASHYMACCNPDIIFLDIELPDGSGFDLLARFPASHTAVVFVTAYDNYAVQAIKTSACDYILKPINIDEFRESVQKILDGLERINMEKKQVAYYHHPEVKKVRIPSLTGYNFVNAQSIIRCEADGSYTSIYFTAMPRAYVSKILSHFENELSRFGFFRIHHKHLVNLNFIQAYSKGKGGGLVTMSDGMELEVSARKKAELLKVMSLGVF